MSTERLHFIGVGGVGMSGIAHVAHDQGMVVTGSDIKESRYTKQLKSYGIPVAIGQAAENVPEGDDVTVVISTAILDNNPELEEARCPARRLGEKRRPPEQGHQVPGQRGHRRPRGERPPLL